jgi:hypothetical protein
MLHKKVTKVAEEYYFLKNLGNIKIGFPAALPQILKLTHVGQSLDYLVTRPTSSFVFHPARGCKFSATAATAADSHFGQKPLSLSLSLSLSLCAHPSSLFITGFLALVPLSSPNCMNPQGVSSRKC